MNEERAPLIMIVDSRLSTLTSLDSLLSRHGFRVSTCGSSADAREAVTGRRFDLVIAGRVEREPRGAALVASIKTLSPETSVLLLVEPADDRRIPEAIAAGADGLLRSSYTEGQVIQRVERILHAFHG